MRRTILIVCTLGLLVAAGVRAESQAPQARRVVLGYELDQVRDLARRVESRARTVRRAAERLAGANQPDERRVVRQLLELEDRASRFREQVDRDRWSLDHTDSDFRHVQRSFIRSAHVVNDLGGWKRVDREFDRLSDAVFELEMYAVDLLTRARLALRDGDVAFLDEGDVTKDDLIAWNWDG